MKTFTSRINDIVEKCEHFAFKPSQINVGQITQNGIPYKFDDYSYIVNDDTNNTFIPKMIKIDKNGSFSNTALLGNQLLAIEAENPRDSSISIGRNVKGSEIQWEYDLSDVNVKISTQEQNRIRSAVEVEYPNKTVQEREIIVQERLKSYNETYSFHYQHNIRYNDDTTTFVEDQRYVLIVIDTLHPTDTPSSFTHKESIDGTHYVNSGSIVISQDIGISREFQICLIDTNTSSVIDMIKIMYVGDDILTGNPAFKPSSIVPHIKERFVENYNPRYKEPSYIGYQAPNLFMVSNSTTYEQFDLTKLNHINPNIMRADVDGTLRYTLYVGIKHNTKPDYIVTTAQTEKDMLPYTIHRNAFFSLVVNPIDENRYSITLVPYGKGRGFEFTYNHFIYGRTYFNSFYVSSTIIPTETEFDFDIVNNTAWTIDGDNVAFVEGQSYAVIPTKKRGVPLTVSINDKGENPFVGIPTYRNGIFSFGSHPSYVPTTQIQKQINLTYTSQGGNPPYPEFDDIERPLWLKKNYKINLDSVTLDVLVDSKLKRAAPKDVVFIDNLIFGYKDIPQTQIRELMYRAKSFDDLTLSNKMVCNWQMGEYGKDLNSIPNKYDIRNNIYEVFPEIRLYSDPNGGYIKHQKIKYNPAVLTATEFYRTSGLNKNLVVWNFNVSVGWSMSFWFNSKQRTPGLIMSQLSHNNQGARGFSIELLNNGKLDVRVDDATMVCDVDVCDGLWHFIVLRGIGNATINKSTFSVVVDAVSKGTVTLPYTNSFTPLHGDESQFYFMGSNSNNYVHGMLSQVIVYHTLLDNEMISIIADSRIDYFASGYVFFENLPFEASVRVYNKESGELVDRLKTDEFGRFQYRNSKSFEVILMFIDETGQFGNINVVSPILPLSIDVRN